MCRGRKTVFGSALVLLALAHGHDATQLRKYSKDHVPVPLPPSLLDAAVEEVPGPSTPHPKFVYYMPWANSDGTRHGYPSLAAARGCRAPGLEAPLLLYSLQCFCPQVRRGGANQYHLLERVRHGSLRLEFGTSGSLSDHLG